MRNESGLRLYEFNVIVRMDPVEDVTAGGIILPTAKKERDELACDEGTLVGLSPLAFTYASEADWGDTRRPQEGDRVLFAQYQGRLYKPQGDNGPTYRILKDKDIVAVIEQPESVLKAA